MKSLSKSLADGFAAQATALEQGGANAYCIETFAAIDEATLAVKAIRHAVDAQG